MKIELTTLRPLFCRLPNDDLCGDSTLKHVHLVNVRHNWPNRIDGENFIFTVHNVFGTDCVI